MLPALYRPNAFHIMIDGCVGELGCRYIAAEAVNFLEMFDVSFRIFTFLRNL